MHNKFCIIDNERVITGSFNPLPNRDSNNLFIISSKRLAKIYEEEFSELWNGIYASGKKTQKYGGKISAHFCPEDNCISKLQKEIRSANRSIHFMTFSFTHPRIATDLALKNRNGIKVMGLFEPRQVNRYSQLDFLAENGLEVKPDVRPGLLHHKVFIIDKSVVITGSFNPTKSGNKRNDENMLIIRDLNIAHAFIKEFERHWEVNS